MALLTGTPYGTIVEQEDLYLEGAPYIYYQDYAGPTMFDADSYYYLLSGTAAYPVYRLGCYEDVSLASDVTMNAIRCDNVGDKDVIQKLNHLELTLSISSLFPLTALRHILRASPVTAGTDVEKMGIGSISNSQYYKVYLPKVYDDDTGDLLIMQLHRAKFVDAWTIEMPSGDKWMVTGVKIWGFADDNKPAGQRFATVIRQDPSVL